MKDKQLKRKKRHIRVRSKVVGTSKIPRLCVFRSNKHIYAQIIDDEKGHILVSASDLELKNKKNSEVPKELKAKVAVAYMVGQLIAQRAGEKKIKKIVFDRGGYKYHGRVKALAEGARSGGLDF